MSILYVTEFEQASAYPAMGMMIPHYPPVAKQAIVFTGGVTPSVPFGKSTRFIRIQSDTTCSVSIGGAVSVNNGASTVTPPATTADMRVVANAPPELCGVKPGDSLSVIGNT